MSHDDFDFEPVRGLPARLPQGERLLWQGAPDWKSLALRGYHVRKIAAYFALLIAYRVGLGVYEGHGPSAILSSCLLLTLLACLAVGVLSLLAYLNARSTVYSITSQRVVLRHGVAVQLTMNIPFTRIDSAAFKRFGDDTGDIALGLPSGERMGYLITWPHLRPGKITRPEPSLRALPDGEQAARILGEALAAHAGTQAVRVDMAGVAAPGVARPIGATAARAA